MKHASATWLFRGLRGQPWGYEEPAEEPLSVQALSVLWPQESLGPLIQVHLRTETHFHVEKQHQCSH